MASSGFTRRVLNEVLSLNAQESTEHSATCTFTVDPQ